MSKILSSPCIFFLYACLFGSCIPFIHAQQETVTMTVFDYVTVTAQDAFAAPTLTMNSPEITPFPMDEYQLLEKRQVVDDPLTVTVTVTVTIYVPGQEATTTVPVPSATAPPTITMAPTQPTSETDPSILTVITVAPTTMYGNIQPAPTDTIVASTVTPTAAAPPAMTATPQVSVTITIPLKESKELTCEYNATQLSDVQYDVVQKVKLILRRINRQIRSQRLTSLGKYITRLIRAVETGLDGDCKIEDQVQQQDFF